MKKIGIFYGPAAGSTEKIAKLIQKEFGSESADLNFIKGAKASDFDRYENIIFGCSTIGGETWNADSSNSEWDIFRPELEKINYNGKTIAIFGLGDHISYPRNFVDSMGINAKIMISKDAKIIGYTNKDDYEFIDSEALIDGKFIGLPIDEDFDSEKTISRIQRWVGVLKRDFK